MDHICSLIRMLKGVFFPCAADFELSILNHCENQFLRINLFLYMYTSCRFLFLWRVLNNKLYHSPCYFVLACTPRSKGLQRWCSHVMQGVWIPQSPLKSKCPACCDLYQPLYRLEIHVLLLSHWEKNIVVFL